MSVRVQFEIGHTAKLKSKKTPDGFTHDWELFVRGIDKADISNFVEKVIFNLHDSFPKPKRAIRDAPYVLKESGYAGFILPIDIYFKNRDEPKRVTYNYDLELQPSGPPVHKNEIKKFVFTNPSDDFRRKLLRGGGVLLVNNSDDKSRDSIDERSQLINKPKLSNETSKKHKIRPEDPKVQTFAAVFGAPITKPSSKVSPDPKNKNSPNLNIITSKSGKTQEKSSSSLVKDRSEKNDKKDKHKHSSPHKEKSDVSIKDKKIVLEEKHDKKEEKKREKSHSKDRERAKDRVTKRPISPKRMTSPKKVSPARSSSVASRGDESTKSSSKSYTNDITGTSNNVSEKLSTSTSNKKSKKEKKSYEKDKEREKKDKERDKKEKEKDDRLSNSNIAVMSSSTSQSVNSNSKTHSDTKFETINKKENTNNSNKDAKEKNMTSNDVKGVDTSNLSEKKQTEKHEKDSEKKHKHKKNKYKEKEKEHTNRDKRKEKYKQKDDIKKVSSQSGNENATTSLHRPSSNSQNTTVNEISDRDTSDTESESVAPSVSEKPENITESSNSSIPDVVVTKPSPTIVEDAKLDKKDRKSRDKTKTEKEDKKRKRKSKEENDSQSRKSNSPAVSGLVEPPIKQTKKDELISKNGDKSNSPHLPPPSTSSTALLPPSSSKAQTPDDSIAFRTPTLSASLPSSSNTNIQAANHDRGLTVDYMSELRELQQKIMTLQDNNELQQVVEMIAATGRFQITHKTFDFDLCALDRHTVQRLQDFFATSCS